MDVGRVMAVASAEMRILRTNRGILITILSPIAMLYIVRPVFELYGRVSGGPNPMLVAAPAVASMWAFFLLSYVGFSFFRDRIWHTWDRLFVSGATKPEVAIGKLLPMFGIGLSHQSGALLMAALFYDFDVTRTIIALLVIGTLYVVVLLMMAMAFVGLFSTLRSISVVQSVAIMAGGAAGGAITPRELLPGWLQAVGKGLPNYWSQQGYTSVLREGVGAGATTAILVLGGYALAFGVMAGLALRRVERVTNWV